MQKWQGCVIRKQVLYEIYKYIYIYSQPPELIARYSTFYVVFQTLSHNFIEVAKSHNGYLSYIM